MAYKYVILGGGVVAGYAAQAFVEEGIEPHELAIVSADDSLPYERPPLSKGYLEGEKSHADILINDESFYTDNAIDIYLNTRIIRFDLPNRRLYAENGDMIGFESLLIATGSKVRELDIPGINLEGVHYLRLDNDSREIRAAAQSAQKIVILGGGYIGMEVSSVLAGDGKSVTVVFPESRLMEDFFEPEMSDFFAAKYAEHGVTLMPGRSAEALHGESHVEQVELDKGDTLDADLVVVGVGVEPAVDLFMGTGLHIDDGIVVNKYLETNRSGIYAAGDVANYYDVLFQKRRRIEHWENAVEQGGHAARVMTSRRNKRPQFMNLRYFFSDIFDLSYEFWGDKSGADEIVYRGDVESGEFSVWWLRYGRMVAAFVMNRPDEERELAPQWIRSHEVVSPDILRDEDKSLRDWRKYAFGSPRS